MCPAPYLRVFAKPLFIGLGVEMDAYCLREIIFCFEYTCPCLVSVFTMMTSLLSFTSRVYYIGLHHSLFIVAYPEFKVVARGEFVLISSEIVGMQRIMCLSPCV